MNLHTGWGLLGQKFHPAACGSSSPPTGLAAAVAAAYAGTVAPAPVELCSIVWPLVHGSVSPSRVEPGLCCGLAAQY